VWLGLQVSAMGAAFGWFVLRTPGRLARLRLCLLGGFGGAAVGAVALGVVTRVPAWIRSGWDLDVLLRGGIMAYGALLGLSIAYAALSRLRGHGAPEALDRLAPCLGALVAPARTGCFLAGCDFGAVTTVPWAVRYPPGSPAFQQHLAAGLVLPSARASLAVHPAQLYEAALGLLMAVVALRVERARPRCAPPGAAFAAAMATYAAGRGVIEVVRGDVARGGPWPLSTSQWISAAVLAGAAVWVRSAARRERG
jgi:prolipoprotein diacylglyceryltransferase